MGAAKNNIVIGILVVIIACLSVSLYRITRFQKVLYEVAYRVPTQIPLDVFVTGFAEAVEKHDQRWRDTATQNVWLRRHLEQTLHRLEMDYELEPIPTIISYGSSNKVNLYEWDAQPDKFVLPYQKPEYFTAIKDPNEYGLLGLKHYIEQSTMSFGFAVGDGELWIENFYERLQRLEQTLETAKNENPK